MRRVSEDWISRTIQTVEATMERHGFVEDIVLRADRSSEKSVKTFDWNRLLRRLVMMRLADSSDHQTVV